MSCMKQGYYSIIITPRSFRPQSGPNLKINYFCCLNIFYKLKINLPVLTGGDIILAVN
ncbi:hypothetical protein DET1197 [Dehalococcoides mccartyi 195]|uniref:Uncharacterized protein n=1 Tax=Dehalococcoides mccartyi (strain ATCC BAA-2266 / KCTC 15142 / 195) TaxID=243164 RepID=Q3Z789_DEHM1|nr:hypothetical protein DET1197 [Dehalococcoides mccartyi 195]